MRLSKDFLGGLLFILLGGGAALVASTYRLGTPAQMGPGFFPMVLGAVVALIGAAISARALLIQEDADTDIQIALRPLIVILAGVVIFGLSIRSLGFILSVVLLIVLSRLADRERNWIELALMIPVMTGVAYTVFIMLLGMPMQLWPS